MVRAMTPKSEGNVKRKNTSAAGAIIERKAIAILEAEGWLVHRAVRTPFTRAPGRFGSNSNDVFGCFDLVAVRFGGWNGKHATRFIQVGRKHDRRAKERKARPVADRMDCDNVGPEVWGFVPGRKPAGQRFVVTRWNRHEWAECDDEVCLPTAEKATP
jgi:hypothetical protein